MSITVGELQEAIDWYLARGGNESDPVLHWPTGDRVTEAGRSAKHDTFVVGTVANI